MHLNLPEIINSEELVLERQRYEFAEEIFYSYASKPEATRYVAWPTHQSIEDTRTYLRFSVNAWSMGIDYSYVVRQRQTNRLIGSIGCINESGKIQFGYILSPTFWNRGIATCACQLLLPVLKAHPEIYRIWTFTDVENVASQKVLIKSGLLEEARLKNWFRFINQGNAAKDCVLFRLPD